MSKNKLATIATTGLELPPDLVCGAARITLLGREMLKVVNHRGIIIYEPQKIILRICDGRLLAFGHDLVMVELDDEQMVVEGHIDSIAFEEDADEN